MPKGGENMGLNYHFGEIESQIRDACNEYPPDFEKIERLMEQCEDLCIVSKDDPEETMLSDIILWYPETNDQCVHCEFRHTAPCDKCRMERGACDGRYLPQIIKLFLKHGFDVRRDEGVVGSACLCNLMFASHDTSIIESEKLLLDAGADPLVRIDNENVIERYEWESFYQSCEHQHRLSNFYHTMAEIAKAASQNRSYQDIEFYEACVGKRIDKIEMACTGVTPSRAIYHVGGLFPKYKNCFATPIIFHCEDKQLCVTRYVDIRIDPTVQERAETVYNIEKFFPDCVGHYITAIDFDGREIKKDKTSCTQPIILIRLDNGPTIRISCNFGELPREESTAFFSVG